MTTERPWPDDTVAFRFRWFGLCHCEHSVAISLAQQQFWPLECIAVKLNHLNCNATPMTPTSCQTVHPFFTLYLTSRAASPRPRPDARRQHLNIGFTGVQATRSTVVRPRSQMRLWRTDSTSDFLHRWLSQRPVISPAPHRPVRRVLPPLREGRRSVFTAGQPRLTPVIPANAGIQEGRRAWDGQHAQP